MKRLAFSVPLLALALVLAFRGTSAPAAAAVAVACPNPLPHEPMIVYEINGGTIAGPFDLELVVYGDGSARLSSAVAGSGPGKCEMAVVPVATASSLLAAISANGAFTLCDDTSFVTDMPLSTLTIMRAKTDSLTHTYSWWVGQGAYAPVEQLLQSFISNTFPNF